MKDLIKKYGDFHDGLISKICYDRNVSDKGSIIVHLGVRNLQDNFRYEQIELCFSDIVSFRLIENFPNSILIISNAKIENRGDLIIFDFFPDIFSDRLEINEESDFIIKCKEITFNVF